MNLWTHKSSEWWMRSRLPFIILLLVCLPLFRCHTLRTTCIRSSCTVNVQKPHEYAYWYIPRQISHQEFHDSFKVEPPRAIQRRGKIYVQGELLLMSEPGRGVHIFDNANPRRPRGVAFLNVIGNHDVAMRGGILYADSYTDLLAIEVGKDAGAIRLASRTADVFPRSPVLAWPPDGPMAGVAPPDPGRGPVVDYEPRMSDKEMCRRYGCKKKGPLWGIGFDWLTDAIRFCFSCLAPPRPATFKTSGGPGPAPSPGTAGGKAGSQAAFAVVDDVLYVLTGSRLGVYSLARPRRPAFMTRVRLRQDVETIFPRPGRDLLFFGTENGMLIYDIKNRALPRFLSFARHIRGCDPVVVKGTTAYVTVRNDQPRCPGATNVLQVFDVRDPTQPRIMARFDLSAPAGLGVAGDRLYVTDGSRGLRVYDIREPGRPVSRGRISGIKAGYDVIPYGGILFVVAGHGLYQYAMRGFELDRLSRIPIAGAKDPRANRLPAPHHARRTELLRRIQDWSGQIRFSGLRMKLSPDRSINGSSLQVMMYTRETFKRILLDHPPGARLVIVGYANVRGKPEDARRLGLARARYVRDTFIQGGIPAGLLDVRGRTSRPGQGFPGRSNVTGDHIDFELEYDE